jgi:hypothetical protein
VFASAERAEHIAKIEPCLVKKCWTEMLSARLEQSDYNRVQAAEREVGRPRLSKGGCYLVLKETGKSKRKAEVEYCCLSCVFPSLLKELGVVGPSSE